MFPGKQERENSEARIQNSAFRAWQRRIGPFRTKYRERIIGSMLVSLRGAEITDNLTAEEWYEQFTPSNVVVQPVIAAVLRDSDQHAGFVGMIPDRSHEHSKHYTIALDARYDELDQLRPPAIEATVTLNALFRNRWTEQTRREYSCDPESVRGSLYVCNDVQVLGMIAVLDHALTHIPQRKVQTTHQASPNIGVALESVEDFSIAY